MQLLGLFKLDEFKRKHADSRGPLDVWRVEVEQAQWVSTQDVKSRYPSASFLADNRVIFNIKGNQFRLIGKYGFGENQVHLFICWIGSHADYSKLCAKRLQYTISSY